MTPDATWTQHMAETLRELARENAATRWGRALATDAARMMRIEGRFLGEVV